MNVPFKNKTSIVMPGISASRIAVPFKSGVSYWTSLNGDTYKWSDLILDELGVPILDENDDPLLKE